MRDGLRFALLIALVALAPRCLGQPTGCAVLPPNVADGTFEAGTPWPLWTTQSSINSVTPLCDTTACIPGLTAAPFSGSNWAWFGGVALNETATLGQSFMISAGPLRYIRFQLRIGLVTTPFTDTLMVSMDGTPLVTFTEPDTAEPAYTQRYVNVTSFADDLSHALLFTYQAPPGGGKANFNVDDVELVACTTPVGLQEFTAE